MRDPLTSIQSFSNVTRQPSKVLSSVKGLAAVKVTSLIDAFNRPFLVGGLRRPENENEKGKAMAPAPLRIDGPVDDDLDPIGSPDWPEEADEPPVERSRGRTPSRSPGGSPEPLGGLNRGGEGRPEAEAWRDPLEVDEDGEDGPPEAKKARMER